MYEEIKLKEVRTRKCHWCEWCNGRLPVGSYVIYRVFVWQGDFGDDYMHNECHQAAKDLDYEDYPDGWTPGSFIRGSTRPND